ncbi:MAG: hypothetical protein FWF81_09195 [Defluviitaleaceae bacterium]|nr:hypothetical protein [Defluviitaleaceae bacterium]
MEEDFIHGNIANDRLFDSLRDFNRGTIAQYYGKVKFAMLTEKWYQYHTFGIDHAINRFAEAFGLPPTVKALQPLSL